MIDGIMPPRREQKDPTNKPPEESFFSPPDFIAANSQDAPEQPGILPKVHHNFEPEAPKKKKSKIPFWDNLGKKQKLLVIGSICLIFISSVGAAALLLRRDPPQTPSVAIEEPAPEPAPPEPEPTTAQSRLTGLEVAKELVSLPVTGVMIENSPDARPQSGLKDAGIVFEAIAEGGITRFLALYQDGQPDYVGPVRSVRPYYLDWLQGFDASIAHVGGSAEALQMIRNLGIKDLDQFSNTGPYQRVSGRYAPHNMYTSLPKLVETGKSKGFTNSDFLSLVRKPQPELNPTPTARTIDLAISSYLYNVHYDYDPATNTYLRNEGGKPHIDERSGSQLNPKVIIAIVVPYSIHSNGVNSQYQTIGSGKAYIFQDGTAIEGIWEKTGAKTQIKFGDNLGGSVALSPGQTWITAVKAANNVSYGP